MYLDRRDLRGVVIFLAVVAFVMAGGLTGYTVDRHAGEKIGSHILVAGHAADDRFWIYSFFCALIGVALSCLAMIRRIWDPPPAKRTQKPERDSAG
ncbi:MAG TPA: hypothetical protein PLF88_04900 [Opitutaceae bacterium]|nr:hypothetical protein [Opitutaceae bacterium]HRJ47735.1 hypothetical protein [Opitutaceae bacterium]